MAYRENTKKKVSFAELKQQFSNNSYYNQPNTFGDEGEDHINISIYSSSELGKILSPEYMKTINYPYLGKFASVSSIWFWIRDENLDDNLRRLAGLRLKAYIAANGSYGGYAPNFKAIIGVATWLKIKQYSKLVEELRQMDTSKTKFLCYSTDRNSGLRTTQKFAPILIEIAFEITKAIKENREPNFDFLADNLPVAGLNYAEGILQRFMTEQKIEELKQNANKPSEKEEEVDEDLSME